MARVAVLALERHRLGVCLMGEGLSSIDAGLLRSDLGQRLPQRSITRKRVDNDAISRRHLRMAGTRVVFLVDRMVNDRSSHINLSTD